MPVILVVGGEGAGKTAVSAAVFHDAAFFKRLRVLALVPSVHSFREALELAGGPPVDKPLPLGCDVVQVAAPMLYHSPRASIIFNTFILRAIEVYSSS